MTTARITIDAVIPSFAAGGAERVTLSLLSGLDASRFDVRLLILDSKGPLSGSASHFSSTVDFGGSRLITSLPSLLRTVRSRRPGILFSSQVHINLALLFSASLLPKTRIVVREANMPSLCLKNAHWPKWYGWVYGGLMRRASTVIATSRAMEVELQREFGVSAKNIALVPNPVDVDAIRSTVAAPERKPGAGRRFVAVGRLVRQKGFDRLIDWMTSCQTGDHLTIVGDGPLRSTLEAAISRLGLQRQITLAGFQPAPWSIVAGADALLMPSRWEGLPNAALEALAVGTPVVATADSGGIQDIADAAPGSVTIAASDLDFVNAMAEVIQAAPTKLRDSFLPQKYSRSECTGSFESVLSGLV